MYPNIDRLDTLTFGGLKTGVRTLKKLLKKLGNPQDSFQVFHVAGTNGKGSVCQMISQVLRKEFGYKVGLTISPHLIKLNERIQINGEMISDDELNSYLAQIYTLTQQEKCNLSYFEHMILVALLYFRDQKVDYAVIEVGLWGKYDATNVFSNPVATLITTISDDHRRLLGPTLTHIFRNKAGIIKPNVPCFTRLDTPLVHWAARQKKTPLVVSKELIETNLLGPYQLENTGLVFTCLATLGFDPSRVKHWLQHIIHPWRVQRLSKNILVDGAHNEEGVQAFAQYVDTIRNNFSHIVTVFGATKTREDYPRFFENLIVGDFNYLVAPPIEKRAVDPATYQQHLSFPTISTSLDTLWDQLPFHDPNTLIIIYGSLYLVGACLEKYEGK